MRANEAKKFVEPKDHEEVCRPIKHFYDEQRMSVPVRKRDIEERSWRRTR